MKGLFGSLIFFIIALHVQGAPQPEPDAQYYHGNPSSYLRPAPGYGGNPSNHVRPWGYSGPASHHTRPYQAAQGMAPWGQPVSAPGKVMIDSEGNYQSSEMGQFGSVSYPRSGNVQVLPRNEIFGGHGGHSGHGGHGNVQVLPSSDIGYAGNPGSHIRPWGGNGGYGGNHGGHLRPWQGRQMQGRKVEVLPINGELPPVQQAPMPPMSMSQTTMGMSQPPMGMSQPGMGMSQPGMGMSQPGMAMPQPVMSLRMPMMQQMNWRKSYQQIPGTGNCYNRCKNRCGRPQYPGQPQYSGCRPSCSNRCNIQPTCGGRMGSLSQPGNFQVSGNTLLCGSRRQSLRPTSPWIPGYPNPGLNSMQSFPTHAQTLPHPIKFDDGELDGDQEIDNASEENEEDGPSGHME